MKQMLKLFIIATLILAPVFARSSATQELQIMSGLETARLAMKTTLGKAGVLGLATHLIALPLYYLDEKAGNINKILDERDEVYNSVLWGQLMQDPKIFKTARQTLDQAVDLVNKKCSEKSQVESTKGIFKRKFVCGVHPSRVLLSRTHYVHQSQYKGETYWFVPATLLIVKNPVQAVAMGLSMLASHYQVGEWVKSRYKLDPQTGIDSKGKYFSEYAWMYGNYILDLPENFKITDKDVSDALAEKIYDRQVFGSTLGDQDMKCLVSGLYCYRIVDLNYRSKEQIQILAPCGSFGIEKLFAGISSCEQTSLDSYLSGLIKKQLTEKQSQIDFAKSVGNTFDSVWTRVIGVGLSLYMVNKIPAKKIASPSRIIRFVGGFLRFGTQVYVMNEAITLPVEGVQLFIEGKVEPTQQLLNGLETLLRQKEESSLSNEEFYKRLNDVFTHNGAEATDWIK